MNYAKSLGRALLLFFILLVGVGLIWQIGRRFPGQPENPELKDTDVPVEPVSPEVPAGPSVDPVKDIVPETAVLEILETDRGRFIATDPILFNSGLTSLREASIPKLDRIAGFLMRNPEIRVEIVGHTDNLGPEPVNQKVSAERAEIVKNYLVSQGIDPSRLRSKGMGSLDPITSNDTQLGRQANRRIEFKIRD